MKDRKMKLIIITSPDFIPDEARIVTELFKAGLGLAACTQTRMRMFMASRKSACNVLLRNIEPGLSFMIFSL